MLEQPPRSEASGDESLRFVATRTNQSDLMTTRNWLMSARATLLLSVLLIACSSEGTAEPAAETTPDASTDGAVKVALTPAELLDLHSKWRFGCFDNREQYAQNPEVLGPTELFSCTVGVRSAAGGTVILTDAIGVSRPISWVQSVQPGAEPGTLTVSYISIALGSGGTTTTGGEGVDAGTDEGGASDASSDAASSSDAATGAAPPATNPFAALIGFCRDHQNAKLTAAVLDALKAARGQSGCTITLTYDDGHSRV